MAKGPCEKFHPDLSAYADGTLPPKRWEQVTYHLAGCDSCCEEVRGISDVCSKLSTYRSTGTPDSLAARLENIAGEHAATPLYMAHGAGDLPSQRRRRAQFAYQGGVALLAVMVSAVVIAVLVAPTPVKVSDPVKAAREQYSRSLTAISVNEAVGAMLLANERGADFGAPESYVPLTSETESLPITRELAANLLRRAADADYSLTGTQRVWASDGEGRYRTADVRTTKMAGFGAQLEVLDVRGDLFGSAFLPEVGTSPVEAPWGWEYSRSGTTEQVAGRDAVRIQANSGELPAARWWVDAATGIMLWAERYDALGRVNLAVGYKQLSLDDASFEPDDSAQLISLQPASSSEADDWCVGLDACPREVGGMSLVAYSSSEKDESPSMSLVYSDGYHTAVVDWTTGVLGDGALTESDRAADMTVEVWQAGDGVLSVACDCAPAMIKAIAGELPEPEAYRETIAEKIAGGLVRMTRVR
ncbi:zf-HC2 domain-containing protein [Tessaracoccus sp. MC1865]|uniref:zf-HC2 domain-containing protein n=1 Tax=Tessaracoccus sp. MC1865 TaxID=2760310 RepID=UPI0015FF280C|nr:zf-HC2 domain-containing protein [Tessaracoccus sp. MC1865]MBB1482286.1 zf-HC2 domain-containing protein [Tessaracoccus sp. MC1865]QTO38244.1 zf-HC2 domain-containing protein [Tessaracoccus sp. MC1865]